MSLVPYPSSEDEDEAEGEAASLPPSKKRKLSPIEHEKKSDLPPLPSSFLDQYSSTVRTSTQDDPSLHGGRKRVTPHVVGNWPAHVYLEWCPTHEEAQVLSGLIAAPARESTTKTHENQRSGQSEAKEPQKTSKPDGKVHSLLESDLGVALPLHISLSRPLILKTNQKDHFLNDLTSKLTGNETFSVLPGDLVWHPNESDTRWFLVLRLESTTSSELGEMKELRQLLLKCNDVALRFGQPMLYANESESNANGDLDANSGQEDALLGQDQFHISLAWSLHPPISDRATGDRGVTVENQHELLGRLRSIEFTEVKVRIGQDVHRLPLKKRRRSREISS